MKKKFKKFPIRIPIGKPIIFHKTNKDYNRKKYKKELNDALKNT